MPITPGAADDPRRSIPDPGFADDDGAVAAEVTAALAAYDADPDARHHATLAVLQDSRLLVPVVALLGEVEYDDAGLAHDKTSDMATVSITGADGTRALLAFTGAGPLARWNPEARPVPVTLRDAARAALQEGARALVVDVAGPVLFAIEDTDLIALAADERLVAVGERHGWIAPG